tara:strand:- start:1064 stop:2230 length:1167 start_codon:yes stop_codon:yes gene_type:complete
MRKVEFGEIATFSQGQQVSIPDQRTEKFDSCDTFLRIVNYTQNSDDFRYIPKQSHKHHVSTDDIIMVRYGAVGFVGRGLSGVLANNMFKINFDKDQVDGNYLFRTLWSDFVQKQLLNASQSTSMAAINFKTTSKITIPLPQLDQQKKIATILDAADAYRQKTKVLIEKYDELTQSLFLDMFGDPVTNPKGWEIISLVNYGSFKNGLNFGRNESGVKLKYLGVGNFKSFYKIDDLDTLSSVELNNLPSEGYLLKDGDLVFVRSNGNKALVGRCIEIICGGTMLTFSGFCIRYRVTSEKVKPSYLAQLFRNKSFKSLMLQGGRGANIQNINQKILSEIRIPVPETSLQDKFITSIKAIEAQKAQAQASLAQAEDLFNSLLQRAFKGELTN